MLKFDVTTLIRLQILLNNQVHGQWMAKQKNPPTQENTKLLEREYIENALFFNRA